MRTFGVIFVLYEPSDAFLRNLMKVRAACSLTVAVDNSREPNTLLHNRLEGCGVEVIFNANRGGLAGAYNRGAERLLARGCEVLFLLDQDSEIDGRFFERMMDAADGLARAEFLIGPKIYEIRTGKYMPVLMPGKRLPQTVRIDEASKGLIETLCVISSGSAMSTAAYCKLGAFREDYFIESIDVEYCLRARALGVPVFMNASVELRQMNGDIKRRGRVHSTNHAPARRYYNARNSIHSLRCYRKQAGLRWVGALMALQQIISVLLVDSHKLAKVAGILCGCVDGVSGRLGEFEVCHPRLAALCNGVARGKKPQSSTAGTGGDRNAAAGMAAGGQ
jgi:rhamnosyltransferase